MKAFLVQVFTLITLLTFSVVGFADTFNADPVIHSAEQSIYIVYPNNVSAYKKIALNIQKELNSSNNKKNQINIYTYNFQQLEKNINNEHSLIIAIGKNSQTFLKKAQLNNPILYTFIVGDRYSFTLENQNNNNDWAAILINQPLQHLISVAERTVKNDYKNNIIISLSENNTYAIEKINRIPALKKGILKVVTVKDNENAAKSIEKHLFNAAALIAIHDKQVWNSKNAGWMLHQAYSYKVPVIGYSEAFLKAGAMVSVYSSTEQVIDAIKTTINQWHRTNSLGKKIIWPETKIQVNKNIAKALHFPTSIINDIEGKQ